jgi:hypothetical protein
MPDIINTDNGSEIKAAITNHCLTSTGMAADYFKRRAQNTRNLKEQVMCNNCATALQEIEPIFGMCDMCNKRDWSV